MTGNDSGESRTDRVGAVEGRGARMFQRVLVTTKPADRVEKTRSLAVAAAVHGALICTGVFVSMLAVEVIQDDARPDFVFSFFELPEPPKLDVPKPKTPARHEMAEARPKPPEPVRQVVEQKRIEFKPQVPEPEIEIPKAQLEKQKLALAAEQLRDALRRNVDAPDVADVAAARATRTASPELAIAQQGRAGQPLNALMDAPEVKVPGGGRGGPGLPARAPGIQVAAGGGGGSMVAYPSKDSATLLDMTVPAPGPRGRPGGRPGGMPAGLVTVPGDGVGGGSGSGGRGLKYGDGPADAPGGEVGSFAIGGKAGARGGGTRIDGVRAALANKYGLPLVSVNDLGQRSTEAARWNMLLPQLSDLMRKALRQGVAGAGGDVVAVEIDGSNVIIRYRDGIVHVLVPTDGGLAALFVARGAGARPVVSKVQEAESAMAALARLTRGAS